MIEKCPKCGGQIFNDILLESPELYMSQIPTCLQCGYRDYKPKPIEIDKRERRKYGGFKRGLFNT